MMLRDNLFIEQRLPASIIRKLSDEEMNEYRRPFLNPGEDRRPTLSWPRQIPIDGDPADVAAIVTDYANWLKSCDIPKLFINAEPSLIWQQCPTLRHPQVATSAGITGRL